VGFNKITLLSSNTNTHIIKLEKGLTNPLFYCTIGILITNKEGYIMKILFEAATLGLCWFAIILALNAFMG